MAIKLGLFKLYVRQLAKKNNISPLEVEILLYGSENTLFSQYKIVRDVPACKPTVIASMKRLHDGGWVKIAVQHHTGVSRKYVISGKARSLITELNLMLGNI